jgi:hypothetical protein
MNHISPQYPVGEGELPCGWIYRPVQSKRHPKPVNDYFTMAPPHKLGGAAFCLLRELAETNYGY